MLKNQPKSIFLSVHPGEESNDFTASVKSIWFQKRFRDTDLEYISLDLIREHEVSNRICNLFLEKLLDQPQMAEYIASVLIEKGYGLGVTVAQASNGKDPWAAAVEKERPGTWTEEDLDDYFGAGKKESKILPVEEVNLANGFKANFVGVDWGSAAGGAAGVVPEFGVGDTVVTRYLGDLEFLKARADMSNHGKEGVIEGLVGDVPYYLVHGTTWGSACLTLVKKAAAGEFHLDKDNPSIILTGELAEYFKPYLEKAAADAGGEVQGRLDSGEIGKFSCGPARIFDKSVHFKDMNSRQVVFLMPKGIYDSERPEKGFDDEFPQVYDPALSYPFRPISYPGSPQPQNAPTNPQICKCGRPVDTVSGNLLTGQPFDYLLCDECYAKEER